MMFKAIAKSKFLVYGGLTLLVLFIFSSFLRAVQLNQPTLHILYKVALSGAAALLVETAVEALLKKIWLNERIKLVKKLLASASVAAGTVVLFLVVTNSLLLNLLNPLSPLEAAVIIGLSAFVGAAISYLYKHSEKTGFDVI